jgi:toxin FitB
MYLLDTDVISARRGPEQAPGVSAWIGSVPDNQLFMSAVTFGELTRGFDRQERINPPFADVLKHWLDMTEGFFENRILPYGKATAQIWGRLSARLGNESLDLMIAATALEHGAIVVTRNVRHFAPTGVQIINPFQGQN